MIFCFYFRNSTFRYKISIKIKHKTGRQLFCFSLKDDMFYIMTSWLFNLFRKKALTLSNIYLIFSHLLYIFNDRFLYLQLYSNMPIQISNEIICKLFNKASSEICKKFVKKKRNLPCVYKQDSVISIEFKKIVLLSSAYWSF